MTRRRAFVAVLLVACVALVGCASEITVPVDQMRTEMQALYGENRPITGEYDQTVAVTCTNGTFVGAEQDGVVSYKGIPYAEQPVGDLRWKAPVLAAEDDGVYEALHFGKSSIQSEWPLQPGSYYEQGEDCLNLNVWVNPANTSTSKPVMIYFHGGSYGWGATSDPLYDGANFVTAQDDIVLVTVDYRLGMLGFLDLSSLEGGEDYAGSGNLGLLDMICSLQWIQQNIAAFGGDPGNVTIFGESAGAGSVSLLPLIEGSEGLFQKVIAESGSVALTSSTDECLELTDALIEATGAASVDDLLALSEEELVQLTNDLNGSFRFPERDGVVLPTDLYEAYESGAASNVMLLTGTAADENRYWGRMMGLYAGGIGLGDLIYDVFMPVTYESDLLAMSEEDQALAEQFLALQNGSYVDNVTEFFNDLLFRVPALVEADAQVANGATAYVYYWQEPCGIGDLGADHTTEIAYVFGNLDNRMFNAYVDADLSATVQEMWANFARTGNPSTAEVTWAPYTADGQETMLLSADDCHIETGWLSEQTALVQPLLGYWFNGGNTPLTLAVPTVYKLAAGAVAVAGVIVCAAVLLVRRRRHRAPAYEPRHMRTPDAGLPA